MKKEPPFKGRLNLPKDEKSLTVDFSSSLEEGIEIIDVFEESEEESYYGPLKLCRKNLDTKKETKYLKLN